MIEERSKLAGTELVEASSAVVNSRFVGRDGILKRFGEILDYPLTGKPMPTVVLRGSGGSGKSWLLYRFAQEIAERRIPYLVLDGRLKASRLPGGFELIARELADRYGFRTPRFNKVYEIYARRFLGIESLDEPQEDGGLLKELFRSFRKEPEDENPQPSAIRKIYGDDWERRLPARPPFEHLNALALALAEDIDLSFQKKKYPFIALLIDDWDEYWDRFYPHWLTLLNKSSRLLAVIGTPSSRSFDDSIDIPVPPFDEGEARSALRRRGIEANHAVAGIVAESGGNPLVISLSSSLAELISRSGDIIKSDTFKRPEKEIFVDYLLSSIIERLRDSEREALYAVAHTSGLTIRDLLELFPEEPNLAENISAVFGVIPCEAMHFEKSPVAIHRSLAGRLKLSETPHLPGDRNILKRCENMGIAANIERFETLATRIEARLEGASALSKAIERITYYLHTGQIGSAEDIWRAGEPVFENRGLRAVHRAIGDELLQIILSPDSRAKFFDRLECEFPEEEGARRLEFARALADKARRDDALNELHDTVSLLSSAITETSGKEPSLWLIRGDTLKLASELLLPTAAYRDALSGAEKAAESYRRAREAGLDCAGVISLKIAESLVLAAKASRGLGETKTATTWLERARENIAAASEARQTKLPDIALLSARTHALRGEIFAARESFDSAEEFFLAALEEIDAMAVHFDISNPRVIAFRAGVFTSLAELLFKSGSEDAAFENINKAQAAYDEYEEAIGGSDRESLMGRGKTLLLKSEILAVDNTNGAVMAAREADGYFRRAWSIEQSAESAFGRIDALITIAELLSLEDRADESVFEEVERIFKEKTIIDAAPIALLERRIRLYKAQGTALFRKGNFSNGARFFSAAIKLYGEISQIAPDYPFAGDVAELQMALSVALKKSGEPAEAFICLQRAQEAFEFAADNRMQEGLKRILHSAITIYNELGSVGKDEDAFETALFILELSAKVGGPEVLETGQDLLLYWESQELTSRDKRRLDESAQALRELWGEF
ncbi:MAG TPA: hypothetical protein ENN07_04070 [candidate division Zixibacteria bacterium]|nr:hypothetical protein [candidate division Zixibacteria bacterium]